MCERCHHDIKIILYIATLCAVTSRLPDDLRIFMVRHLVVALATVKKKTYIYSHDGSLELEKE